MARTKAFLFDLDGVIVDTAKFHFLAWKEIAQKVNCDFTEIENEKLKGVSRVNSLNLILKWGGVELSEEEKSALLIEKNELYLSKAGSLSKEDLLPGVSLLIKGLEERNIKKAIGSASKNARMILEKLNVIEAFDFIIDGNDVVNSKPDPEVFVKGAEACQVTNEECLVIEDSAAGLEAAHSAGMKTIGVGESPELNIADYQLDSLMDLTSDLLNEIIEE